MAFDRTEWPLIEQIIMTFLSYTSWHIMAYHDISWHFCLKYHDILWQIITYHDISKYISWYILIYHDISWHFVIWIKEHHFVAKARNYGIFVAKFFDSFWGSAGFIDSHTSYATLTVDTGESISIERQESDDKVQGYKEQSWNLSVLSVPAAV